jgi:hypothetical protein
MTDTSASSDILQFADECWCADVQLCCSCKRACRLGPARVRAWPGSGSSRVPAQVCVRAGLAQGRLRAEAWGAWRAAARDAGAWRAVVWRVLGLLLRPAPQTGSPLGRTPRTADGGGEG